MNNSISLTAKYKSPRKRKPEDEDKDKDEDENQTQKKHKSKDNANISSLELAGDYYPNSIFKKGVGTVIIANRFKVRRTREDNEKLVETFKNDKRMRSLYGDLEERSFITKFFTGVSNYLKQAISGSTNTYTTSTLSTTLSSSLSTDYIHPPLPNGWTENNDNDNAPPYFIDSDGYGTYDRPYVPLPPIPNTVSPKWVSCTIIGHGGLVNVYPRLFSPGPMCHVRYFTSFANPVRANNASDTRGYKLQQQNARMYGQTTIEDYDKDYVELAKYAYNQERHQNKVLINIHRTKKTDSVTCLNKMFTFLENIGPNIKIAQERKDEIKRINEANFGVYIMRNNLGIQEGHKLDITNIDGYPYNVVFQDIAGFITEKLGLIETDHLYVLDPTCNPVDYVGFTDRDKRHEAHNFEQLIEEINEHPNKNSEIISGNASQFLPSVYGKGGSKRRKQKKTRKNKKM